MGKVKKRGTRVSEVEYKPAPLRLMDQRFSQQFGHVFGVNGREVFQLMPATGSGSDNDAVRRLHADLLNKRRGDFER